MAMPMPSSWQNNLLLAVCCLLFAI